MPNIIEQQDLLKGLPDARLSMLMQNPTGDIPPFLVAAEAQRRQSIREQFSGGPQESVVDTLTKQLANVPQNIEAPMQTPPQMPPPQMQAGVGALQPGMRRGGFVQRYQAAGLVAPLQTRVQAIADQFGMTVEQAAAMLRNDPSLGAGGAEADYGRTPVIPDSAPAGTSDANEMTIGGYTLGQLYENAEDLLPGNLKFSDVGRIGYGLMYPPIAHGTGTSATQVVTNRDKMTRDEAIAAATPRPGSAAGMAFTPSIPKPRDPDASKNETSIENKMAPETDELREQLADLMKAQEPSNWDKAQKWFAAAQAAIKPGQSNWEATINALAAFGGGSAEERAAQRAAVLAEKKALLEYDIYARDREAAAQQKERERTTISANQQADIFVQVLKNLEERNSDIRKQISDIENAGFATPEAESRKKVLLDEQEKIQRSIENYSGGLSALGEMAYGPINYETYNLGKGLSR
jgi:hypothetical protein